MRIAHRIIIGLTLLSACRQPVVRSGEPVRKAVFIILDGIPADVKTAIRSTWLDNRAVRIGEGKPGAGDFTLDHAVDGFVRQADAQVGRIGEAVKRRESLGEDWMLVVTTDPPRLDARFASGTPAIVDIAPSILQHLRIAVPTTVANGMDGVSFLRRSGDEDGPLR